MNNENNVYYKVLDKNMKSPYRRFPYELGKTYSTDEKLEICENGFHACKNIYEMIIWSYNIPLKDHRFFDCTLGDKVIEGDHKVVSNSITLTKEIPFEEVDKSIRENLDILVHDKDEDIRRAVALHGYCLDILVHDKDWYVREAVAIRGYGLETLLHDKDEDVRAAVAQQGYGLDILIHDEDIRVRAAVASQGYGLDILINDEDWSVRNMAKQMLNKEKINGQ